MHGDLSEYNIMVVPTHLVDHRTAPATDDAEVRAVLIDFGQAVDVRDELADSLLERDIERVLAFFAKQGVNVITKDEALAFILEADDL